MKRAKRGKSVEKDLERLSVALLAHSLDGHHVGAVGFLAHALHAAADRVAREMTTPPLPPTVRQCARVVEIVALALHAKDGGPR